MAASGRVAGNVVRIKDGESDLSARTIKRRLATAAGLYDYLVTWASSPVSKGMASRRGGQRAVRCVPLIRADDGRLDVISRAPEGHERLVERAEAFQRSLHKAGFSGLDLPEMYGGKGLSRIHAKVLSEELRRYDTPSLAPLGIGQTLAKSTLLAAGTEKQKRRYLPGLATGQQRWCQLFSEPDAGSDLVSLRTRAVLDGGVWVVNGQKVWSSYAAGADCGMLLARTNPDAERPHAGITMFILPMSTPGVSVRPLVDIAGGEHFNEVFLEDVQIPAESVPARRSCRPPADRVSHRRGTHS